MFDEKTMQELKAYVYMLIDPRNNTPFYVGKGNNNRVFEHMETAINNENVSTLKYDTIREIKNTGLIPIHMIIRHGLSDTEAFHVESALIDTIEYLGMELSNIVNGHNYIEKGIMSSDHIKARYQAKPLGKIDGGCVIININKTYKRNSGPNSVYLATKEIWNMKDPTGKIKTVLSEYHGLIVEVFDVEQWYTKERVYGQNTKKAGEKYLGYGFNGHVSQNDKRNKYIYRSIAHLKKKGAANVIRYNL